MPMQRHQQTLMDCDTQKHTWVLQITTCNTYKLRLVAHPSQRSFGLKSRARKISDMSPVHVYTCGCSARWLQSGVPWVCLMKPKVAHPTHKRTNQQANFETSICGRILYKRSVRSKQCSSSRLPHCTLQKSVQTPASAQNRHHRFMVVSHPMVIAFLRQNSPPI